LIGMDWYRWYSKCFC